jgi:hypothetical protein
MITLRSIFGGKSENSKQPSNGLSQKLAQYQANMPPFPGHRRTLTAQKLDSNLTHLVATCDTRLGLLSNLLSGFGIDITPMLDPAQDPHPTATAIDDWLTAHAADLAKLPRSAAGTCPADEFQNSDRSGDVILYSLIADLALLEGEAIRRRDDRFYWAINRDVKLRSLTTAKRPCLMRPIQPNWVVPMAIDFEMAILGICHERRNDMGMLHTFGEQMTDVLRGAYDPA